MFALKCLNPVSQVGLHKLSADYRLTDDTAAAEGILVRSADMHEMELGQNLLAVARAGAGVNNIPLEKCAEQGIVVFNTPGANANGVKELVITGMLLASRDVVGGIEWIESNREDGNIAKTAEREKKVFAGREIKGKKLGVIGLGAIGVLVANAASDLGMDVYGCDPYLSVQNAVRLSRHVHIVPSNDDIFAQCDYITLHVPAMPATKGMIDAEAIAKMKDGVVLLNFSRDVLVNDEAMAAALQSGKVFRYVTDFPNPAVVHMDRAIVLPHLGASTEESEDNCAVMAVEELTDYLEHGNITNSVNYPACSLGLHSKATRVCVAHYNKPGAINKLTALLGENGANISDMMSKSRDRFAYAIFDLESELDESTVERLAAVDSIIKVRVIR